MLHNLPLALLVSVAGVALGDAVGKLALERPPQFMHAASLRPLHVGILFVVAGGLPMAFLRSAHIVPEPYEYAVGGFLFSLAYSWFAGGTRAVESENRSAE